MKKTPYGIVICRDDDAKDLRDAFIAEMRNSSFSGVLHAMPAPAMQFDSAFGMKFADMAASLQWAIGMAEEAIAVREAGDDEADTPDIIAMHREELARARQRLAHLQECLT